MKKSIVLALALATSMSALKAAVYENTWITAINWSSYPLKIVTTAYQPDTNSGETQRQVYVLKPRTNTTIYLVKNSDIDLSYCDQKDLACRTSLIYPAITAKTSFMTGSRIVFDAGKTFFKGLPGVYAAPSTRNTIKFQKLTSFEAEEQTRYEKVNPSIIKKSGIPAWMKGKYLFIQNNCNKQLTIYDKQGRELKPKIDSKKFGFVPAADFQVQLGNLPKETFRYQKGWAVGYAIEESSNAPHGFITTFLEAELLLKRYPIGYITDTASHKYILK